MSASEVYGRIREKLATVVVGQDDAAEQLAVALVAQGHVLMEGVPGVAKTLLAKAFARCLDLKFRRVQFTPDLMPSDITGTSIFRPHEGKFELSRGPIFTQFLLADEINRTPPKTQSALLEAMEEHQVTIEGESHDLGPYFLVVATQNPLEYEGTYPLPEAQTDRFLLKISMGYPEEENEREVLRRHHDGFDPHELSGLEPLAGTDLIDQLRADAQKVKVDDTLFTYVVSLTRASRRSPRLRLGASPRATVAILAAAKARTALSGSDYLTPDDVKAIARPVLRHRLVLKPETEIEGLTVDDVIGGLLDEVEVPR